MSSQSSKLLATTISALLVAAGWSVTVRADDSEIFNVTAVNSANPNVLFILDTSGSMGSGVYSRPPYDPKTTYPTNWGPTTCDPNRIYFRTGTRVPSCANSSFATNNLVCSTAKAALLGDTSRGYYGGDRNGDNAIAWLKTVTTTTISTEPGTKTQTRTITSSRTKKQVVIENWELVRNTSSGAIIAGTDIKVSTASDVTTFSTAVKVTGTPATSTTMTGVVTPGTPNAVTNYVWTSNLVVPVDTSVSSLPSLTNGTPGISTPAGTWVDGTPSIAGPTKGAESKSGGTTNGGTQQKYTYKKTTTITTPQTMVQTETTTTPVTSSSTKTEKAYTMTSVECDGDKAVGTPSLGFPNSTPPTQWTTNSANSYWVNGGSLQQYTFYSGNYLNYLGSATTTYEGTRLSVMQEAIGKIVDNSSGINVGLMRYDVYASGGMVTYPLSGLDGTTRTAIKNTVNSYTAAGNTPLSETLYEAMRYYSGGDVLFGNTSNAFNSSGQIVSSPSVAGSRVGNSSSSNQYKSPMVASCQKNYIVYLTDGLPTSDVDINSLAQDPDIVTLGGVCNSTNSNSPNGICLGALTKYLNYKDFSSVLNGTQNVSSYFIGFGDDFAGTGGANAFKYLQDAAKGGGGQAYTATSATELVSKMTATLTDIVTRNASLTSPGVAVNNFNRTTTFNDLYYSVFTPTTATHWPGNVKKYRLAGGTIVDQNGDPAIDPTTGFFDHSALSFWTGGDPDGANPQLADGAGDGDIASAGGAAHRIASPADRNVYTYLGTNKPSAAVALSDSANHVSISNTGITGLVLGDNSLTKVDRDRLINWTRGQDIDDKDNPDGDKTDKRSVMGAPLHSRPAVMVYGGTSADPDSVIFAATNDGYLHAIGGKDNDGAELWSFIPKEILSDIKNLYDNPVTSTTHYSLDGDVVLYKDDVNGDGIIDPGTDRVVLIVGRGRGGSNYYALDVTSKTEPKFLWSLGESDLPGLGQAWSTPVVTRVKVDSATQNPKKSVLVFAGGYDPQQETPAYRSTDSVGNKVYFVDTLTGNLLWSAGSSGANLNIDRMTHSIPSDVAVVDIDSDGYADRMYVGDMGGQILRFDIFNGQPASTLVTGGVIASLGAHDEGAPTDATNRRFYAAPSIAAYTPAGGRKFFNLAIGSGYRGHPLNKATQDRIYGVRDTEPFRKFSQKNYDDLMANTNAGQGIIKDSELTDVSNYPTTVPVTSRGWKLPLNQPSWQGEKILSKALTLEGVVTVPSYIPSTGSTLSENGCSTATTGTNRLYSISMYDGSPVKPKGDSFTQACTATTCSANDRFDELAQGGIAPDPILLFTQIGDPSPPSSSSSSSSSSADPPCKSIARIGVGTYTACSNLKNPLFRASFKQVDR